MTSRPRALVTAPLRGPGFAKLRQLADVVYDPWIDQTPLRIYSAEQLAERIDAEAADVVVVESDSVGGPVFEQGSRALIAVAATRGDPNNVDIEGASAAGVPVLSTPGRNADAVAELTVALLLAVTRHVLPADADVRGGNIFRDGGIPYQRFRGREIAGLVAGLVGLGAVGRATRWRLSGLGLRVIAHDPYNDEARHALGELLDQADVVSLHAPVTERTVGMIGAREFAAMRDGVVFLNTARAQLHDTDALVDALRGGKVAAAGLDHFAGEWLPPDHPLTTMPNVVLTPHIGGATWDTEARQAQMVADDLEALLSGGTPAHIVNPEVLAR
ncbi:NAD(P)-dependent oxidoreductase [Mycobacterium parmense]|uniref:D-3-phosphoglycerate dehydrogenase n=1 Tax=Mycobacterium parmense TaxID=185642 RepID=A0A7I7YV79_9MYCO|nr:NAD(P)-dependent oxidoreductase [Mycobacterium parmense]MCV7350789.1 3-phosphoglycerate dehydrogenase [Mycobacterium parmense]ORW48475.1 3-phosphoglycerate dehydrogenase [Mycobacterium parmense]BBZ45785.1 D-3-phosphoglycerate dehydrogenase [Mycobacterium parmense]